ncbi:MAG: ABC transporter substrate-binding protein [candidate division Zixibacteria bacterium]|nr:ABC transporter substrate-binding protein [candidate division Zixibacteria bacterium]
MTDGQKTAGFISGFLIVCVSACGDVRIKDSTPRNFPTNLDAKEAPMLAAAVATGDLPPLEERLPDRPLVARHDYAGYERPGSYGGTWHAFHTGSDLGVWKMVGGYAPLIRWNWSCTGLEPGLAESWSFNADGTELTLHLRRGVRWSDGHPYTSRSFAFWYELCLDDRHQYVPPVWCLVDGKPMTVETPDEYTIVMKFAGPNWLVPLWLATGYWWSEEYNIPEHYMKRYHPDINPAYTDFVEFQRHNVSHQNPERPSLWPWRIARIEKGGFRVFLERNPYYFVVDDHGRQLPYIDRIETTLIPEPQVRVLKVLAGEIDCQFRDLDLRDLGLLVKGQERGDYRIKMWKSAAGAEPAVNVNWDDKDPVLRGLIRDQRFRKALALSVDRERCNEIAYRGLLQPQAATVSREAWHFSDPEGQRLFAEWEKADAGFDLSLANRYLDEMGLVRRDAQGYRLRPDGKRLSMVLDAPASAVALAENDVALIIADGWRKIGIDVVLYTPPGAELKLRRDLGTFTVHLHSEAEMDLFTYPDWVFPTVASYWHPRTGKWYQTGGKEGEAPSGPMIRLVALYDAIKGESSLEKRHALVREAARIHIDEGPFHIGTVGRKPYPVIVGNDFHNVPDEGILGPWAIVAPAISFPEQYFMESAP